MNTISEILTAFKADLETNIPALLTAEGLDNFDVYTIGQSRNERQKALCIYKSDNTHDDNQNTLTMLFQLQLYGIDYAVAELYGQVIFDYLKIYDPEEIGMNYIDSMENDSWPMEKSGTTLIYIEVRYVEMLDSCD